MRSGRTKEGYFESTADHTAPTALSHLAVEVQVCLRSSSSLRFRAWRASQNMFHSCLNRHQRSRAHTHMLDECFLQAFRNASRIRRSIIMVVWRFSLLNPGPPVPRWSTQNTVSIPAASCVGAPRISCCVCTMTFGVAMHSLIGSVNAYVTTHAPSKPTALISRDRVQRF